MKVASLFDLVADSKNILDFFERVETAEQLISRLERLKRQGPTELLDSLEDMLHLNSEALVEAAHELCDGQLHRPRATEVFQRQLQEAADKWPRLAKQVEKASAALQADRHAGAAVHLATVAPDLATEFKDSAGPAALLRLALHLERHKIFFKPPDLILQGLALPLNIPG